MEMEYMNSCIEDIEAALKFTHGIISSPTYSNSRRYLAMIYLNKGEELEAIYNLTESHGIALRQIGLTECARSGDALCYADCLSFEKGYAQDKTTGMLKRLREMPSEWTIVQLTREFDSRGPLIMRVPDTSPGFKGFHLTRLPCGSDMEVGCPLTEFREWPENAETDLIADFWRIKKQLGTTNVSNHWLRKFRKEASLDIEKYCREIGDMCFKEWLVLCLGKIQDKNFSNWIRAKVDLVLNSRESLNKKQKYMTYVLAEGAAHISDDDLDCALYQLFPEDTTLQEEIFKVILEIKLEKPNFAVVRRHPVILIVDEHLDLIPWEAILVLRRHPISRVPSLHFAHALYKVHCKDIKDGLIEIDCKNVCYYVLNPMGDLRSVEERLTKFINVRLPSWIGIVGEKPSQEQLIDALTNGNAFIYCGHGSGCQYLAGDTIQRLKVKPVQLLFGCSSVALKDHGGSVDMTGDFLQYTIAGSGCTLGTLWAVTSHDIDKMTLALANICLPGEPIDIDSFQRTETIKKEPELLRALVEVRNVPTYFSNGAGFIARGLPIKII